MALALYRKYRPRTFAEVIGQEHVTEPLMQALRTGRLNHAYLFSGPRGCGKTSSARILARSLNCERGPTPEPCGECDSCLALAPDGPGSIDVIEIDAASHGGVDDARDLRERAFFAPVSSRFKVYIIDEAHMVSTQGFNALLKLVEEPPEYVKFVFATTEPEKVLGTIRSRTHHYPFRLIPPNALRPYLEYLCEQEAVTVEPAVFPLVVRAGGGSVRDSLSMLDQLIAGAGADGVSYARAVALLGVTDVALIDEMIDALAAGDGAAAFGTIDRVADAGHDPRRFTGDLLERLRDLIVLQKVTDAAASGIISAPSDQLERMTAQASHMGPATLSRLADIAHNGLTEMRGTTAPRLLLELLVARMLLPGADESHGALLQRLERMERRLGATDPGSTVDPASAIEPVAAAVPPPPPVRAPAAPDRTRPAPPAPSARASADVARRVGVAAAGPAKTANPATARPDVAKHVDAAPAAAVFAGSASVAGSPADGAGSVSASGSLDAAAVRRVWDEILTVVRRRSPRAWAVVREAVVRDVDADVIVLVFQHAVHANMFGAQADLLVAAVGEVLGGRWRVQAELGGDAAAARPAPAPSNAGPSPSQPPAKTAPRPAARAAAASTPPAPVGDDGWPTPAALGGPADQSAPAGGVGPASPAKQSGNGRTAPKAPSRPAQDGTRSRAGDSSAGRANPAGTGFADGSPLDEPPWDPDYDAAPRAGYESFDPGDEPLDDGTVVRETSEEQAIRVLTEHFGAEKIGEGPPRR